MKKFAVKSPIIFEILLVVACYLLSLVVMLPLQAILNWPTELASAMGRIAAAVVFFLVFINYFKVQKQFSGFLLMLPSLLFALWNVLFCYISGGKFVAPDLVLFILGFAPGFFEEIIFRFIFISNMKAKGMKPRTMMLLSGVIFGLMHLMNAIAQPLPQILLQVGYSMVVGFVFAAIYIRSEDLVPIIISHSAIDITNRIFTGGSSTSLYAVPLFAAILIAEAVYAFFLVRGAKEENN